MKEKFNIEIRDISSIKPYDKNPRQNDGAVDAVGTIHGQKGRAGYTIGSE